MENVFVGADFSPEEIQIYTDLFKEFCDVFSWSYEEMPGIDPKIVEHEITMYPDAKPVQQKLHPINPKKATAIKIEVEKLLKAGFIYPIHLTQWVSNTVSINKKQGMIRVCTDFCDLNKACPKKNFQHHSSIRSLINVLVAKPFLSWTVFRDIIKSKSNQKTNTK
jgi:hypothetical protein